jgi:hypothetical protein
VWIFGFRMKRELVSKAASQEFGPRKELALEKSSSGNLSQATFMVLHALALVNHLV